MVDYSDEPSISPILYENDVIFFSPKPTWQKTFLLIETWTFNYFTPIYFYRRPHTLTVLFCLTCILVYLAFQPVSDDSAANTKRYESSKYVANFHHVDVIYKIFRISVCRGILAMMFVFLLFGVLQSSNGPFLRPHPVFWRLIFNISVLYEICLVFILFQVRMTANCSLLNSAGRLFFLQDIISFLQEIIFFLQEIIFFLQEIISFLQEIISFFAVAERCPPSVTASRSHVGRWTARKGLRRKLPTLWYKSHWSLSQHLGNRG